MKKIIIILLTSFVIIASRYSDVINKNVGVFYENQLHKIDVSISALKKATLFKDKHKTSKNYLQLRADFKRIEFLLAQVDREFYLKYINGAPLPKLEKKVPDLRVLEPKGLQVIDELLAEESYEEALSQLNLLQENFKLLAQGSKHIQFSNEFVLMAIHYQLIRDYTLGLTGFDTPGSLNGIDDAQHSATGMLAALQVLDTPLPNDVLLSFGKCISYLKANTNFNDLNRAQYYKEFWQPCFAGVVALYETLDVKSWSSVYAQPLELNFSASDLFDTQLFNSQAFIDFNKNDVNENTIQLGEKLFFESALSMNNKMSCATCHNPSLAFTDGEPKSKSSNGLGTVTRNAPTLLNSIYAKRFFYDLRADKLSLQFEHVIFSEDEFNTTLLDIFKKLEQSENYVSEFKVAFPSHSAKPINIYTFKTALSAYLSSLVGFNSDFDNYIKGTSGLNQDAIAGFNLFMGKAACATCHFAPTFSGLVPPYFDDTESEVLGVPADKLYQNLDSDLGRYSEKLPKEKVDFYKHSFKTTTLRHVYKTAPYMHNGVFSTLEEVVEFYNNGGGAGHGLDVPYQTLGADSLKLSAIEQKQLVAFMKALN